MAGDGLLRRWHPGPRRRALPADRSLPLARRSVLWRARCWPCRSRWRAIRMADAMEPLRQNVEQEAPDELAGRQRHRAKPLPAVAAVILVAEGYAALVEADQAAGCDSNAVGGPG